MEVDPGNSGTEPQVTVTEDELEAIRLAVLEGLYQDETAGRIKISRATFGRILAAARRKVAEALVPGKAIRMGRGMGEVIAMRKFLCSHGGTPWEVPHGIGWPPSGPKFGSTEIPRDPEDRRRPGIGGI